MFVCYWFIVFFPIASHCVSLLRMEKYWVKPSGPPRYVTKKVKGVYVILGWVLTVVIQPRMT